MLESRITPVFLAQHGSIIAYVVNCRLGIPKNGAVNIGKTGMQSILSRHLIDLRIVHVSKLSRALHILADKQRTGRSITVPPFNECLIVGSLMTNLPIYLRHIIVHPSVVHPKKYVSVKVVIVLCAIGVAANLHTWTLVAIDAERRYAELHPRLQCMYVL